MQLHVLAGSAELLRPVIFEQEAVTGLLGSEIDLAPVRWLRNEGFYHDFLGEAPGDGRIEVFARALRQDFGTRFEPLIVLPDLLSEAAAPEGSEERLSGLAVLERIWAHGGADSIRLTAIAVPAAVPEEIWEGAGTVLVSGAAAALDDLRTVCTARGIPAHAVETRVVETGWEHGALAAPWRNALAGRLAAHLGRRLAAEALVLDPGPAQAALVRLLELWSRAGIEPAPNLRPEDFVRLSDRALSSLLAVAVDG